MPPPAPSASVSVPPMRSASSRPIARPRPKPPSEPRAPAVEALEDPLALLGRDARAAVGHRDGGVLAWPAVTRIARAVGRSAARCRSGSAPRARPRPGRRGPSTGRRAARPRSRCRARRRAARTPPPPRARARRARPPPSAARPRRRAARGRAAPRRACESRCSSRRAVATWILRVGHVGPGLVEVLGEQLHRALEHRQRRPQLVRRRGHERAARRLLAAQLLLHRASARARSPTSSWPVSRGIETSGPSAEIRSAAARRRPSRRSSVLASRKASATATSRPTPAAASSALRTSFDRVADLGQPPPRDDRADDAAVAVERDADREVVAAHVQDGLLAVGVRTAVRKAWRGGGPLSESARKPGGDSSAPAGVSARSVTSTRPAVGRTARTPRS